MNSFISWVGGKKLLRDKILAEFPEEKSFGRYIEVFGGAGWILFAKDKHAALEVYNDKNGELSNLFRCVKYHPEALQKELEWTLISREMFENSLNRSDDGMTDIQRAARYFLIIKESYGSKMGTFIGWPKNIKKAIEYIAEVSERLQRTVIENKGYEYIIKRYDAKDALFYLDPPYYDAESYYGEEFEQDDHKSLAELLHGVKGKFILSYNDNDVIREMYKDFNIIGIDRSNNLAVRYARGSRYKEIIVKNY